MKTIIVIIVVSVVHYFVSIWLSIQSFAHTYSYVNTERELTIIEKINDWLVEILFFPIVAIFVNSKYEGASVLTEYFPFILNSLLWGVFIVFACKIILSRNK